MDFWAIITVVLGIIIVAAIVYLWGYLVNLVLPKRYSAVGDKVHIFLGGVYNREATITGISQESVTIYDTLPLPLGYRGKFYAIGYDRDGIEFWFLADKSLYWLVPFVERIRKAYKVIDCPFNFIPVDQPLEPVGATGESESGEGSGESATESEAGEGTSDES